jgi:hypothetical protein
MSDEPNKIIRRSHRKLKVLSGNLVRNARRPWQGIGFNDCAMGLPGLTGALACG